MSVHVNRVRMYVLCVCIGWPRKHSSYCGLSSEKAHITVHKAIRTRWREAGPSSRVSRVNQTWVSPQSTCPLGEPPGKPGPSWVTNCDHENSLPPAQCRIQEGSSGGKLRLGSCLHAIQPCGDVGWRAAAWRTGSFSQSWPLLGSPAVPVGG